MSLAEFQRVLVRMYTSPLFLTDLEMDFKHLQGYQLSEVEIETLTQLAAMKPKIENFADGLYRKKFGYFWGQFSTVNKFFGLIESEVLTAFKDYYDFKDRGEIEDIDYFANFLNDFAQTSKNHLIKYFKEAVKYDKIICKALLLPLPDVNFDKINVKITSDDPSGFRDTGSLLVTKSPSVFIEKFNYNIPALPEGIDINELQNQPAWFAFIPLKNSSVQVYRLSPALKFIVEKAETPTSIDDIVREAAFFQNLTSVPEKFKQACIGGIQKLGEKGILVGSTNLIHAQI